MFDYEGIATIKNLNLRRQIEGDDAKLGTDIKMLITGQLPLLETLIGDRVTAHNLKMALWSPEGELRTFSLGVLSMLSVYRRHNVTIDGVELKCVTLDSFSVVPQEDWRLAIEFRVKLNPDTKEIGGLSQSLINGMIEVKICGEQDELDLAVGAQS